MRVNNMCHEENNTLEFVGLKKEKFILHTQQNENNKVKFDTSSFHNCCLVVATTSTTE